MATPLTPKQREDARLGSNLAARRRRWEAGVGAARMRDARDLLGVSKPDAEGRGGYTLPQVYEAMGYNDRLTKGIAPEHDVHDDQPHLPGLENRDAAPLSAIDSASKRGATRWEDLSPSDQQDIARRVKAKSGATLDSMATAYGAQLDQSVHRAAKFDTVPPHFYGAGEPHEVIGQTAKDMGVTRGTVTALHADNSPQTPFVTGRGDTRRYPQDQMARAAISAVRQSPGKYAEATSGDVASLRPPKAMGYTSNFAKSVRRADQIVNEGVPAGDTSPNKTSSGFGPKTGPYQRAFTGSTSSQFVSDVHSGGGGMVPHLGFTKKDQSSGNSEREQAIAVGGFHMMADAAARRAHRARSLHMPVKRGQEAQWVEEQIQRPDHQAVPQTERSVYASFINKGGPTAGPKPDDNQMRLF